MGDLTHQERNDVLTAFPFGVGGEGASLYLAKASSAMGIGSTMGEAGLLVGGAGLGGWMTGAGMETLADSGLTRTGFWGQDAGGHDRSAMDWGANWGTAYDEWAGNKGPSVIGGIASGLGGIVGGIAGSAQAAGKLFTGLF
jgi:hypothetical protein